MDEPRLSTPPVVEATTPLSSGLPNPGTFDDLSKELHDTFGAHLLFEGLKLEGHVNVGPNMTCINRFALNAQEQKYTLAPFLHSAHGRAMVFAEADTAFNIVNGRYVWPMTQHLTLQGQFQLTHMGRAHVAELELTKNDYAVGFKLVNPSVFDRPSQVTFNYLQAITQRLALGLEFQTAFGPHRMIRSGLVLGGRYSGPNYVVTATGAPTGHLTLGYLHRLTPTVAIGSELQMAVNSEDRDSVLTVGGEMNLPNSSFRGQLNTAGHVSVTLTENLNAFCQLHLSGELDHFKSAMRFGVGVTLTPPPTGPPPQAQPQQ